MKNTQIIALISTCLLLTACDLKQEVIAGRKQAISERIYQVCIDGVVYLVFDKYKGGGITPKVNANFYPYTCNNSTNQSE